MTLRGRITTAIRRFFRTTPSTSTGTAISPTQTISAGEIAGAGLTSATQQTGQTGTTSTGGISLRGLGGGTGGGGTTDSGISIQDISPTSTQQEIIEASRTGGLTDIQKFEASGGSSLFEGIKEVGSTIATPFVDVGKQFYEGVSGFVSPKTRKKLKELGGKAEEFIEEKEQEVTEKAFPSLKEERLEQEDFENKVEDVGKKIEDFNKKYSGKELNELEYNKALKEQKQIENQITQLETEQRTKQIRKEFEIKTADPLMRFTLGAGVGLVSSPFELSKFGVGLATEPITTIQETIEGFADIPTQLAIDPFLTAGELVGSFAGQSIILGGGIRGLKGLKKAPTPEVGFVKPADIKKTPLSKTFADPDLFLKTRPSQLGLKRFRETQVIKEATQKYLQGADIDSALKRISRRPTTPKDIKVKVLERVKEVERIERAKEKSPLGKRMAMEEALIKELKLEEAIRKAGLEKVPLEEPLPIHKKAVRRLREQERIERAKEKTSVGRAMATEEALLENLKLEKSISKAGLQKIPIEEPFPIHRKAIKRVREKARIEEATKKTLGDDVLELKEYLKGLQEIRYALGEIKTIKPSEAGIKAIKRIQKQERLRRARESILRDEKFESQKRRIKEHLDEIELDKLLKKHDLRKGVDYGEIRETAIKRYKEEQKAKEIKPSFEFDIDFSELRSQLKRIKTGADKVMVDKDLNIRVRESEPRFKTPEKIKKLKKRAERPSFRYEEIPDEVKGEVTTAQTGRQQQVLVKPEQIQKEMLKTEPPQKVVKILSEKEISRILGQRFRLSKEDIKLLGQRQGMKLSDKDIRLLGRKIALSQEDVRLLGQRLGVSEGDVRLLGQRILQEQKLKPRQKLRQAQKQVDLDPLRQIAMEVQKTRVRTRTPSLVRQKQKVRQKQLALQLESPLQAERQLEKEMLKTEQVFETPIQRLKEAQAIKEIVRTRQILRLVPKKPKKFRFKRTKRKGLVSPKKPAPSYDAYIKPPKKKKFIKVTKKPVGLMEARDTRNYFIDETTSRQGYLKPRKVKPSPLMFDIPRGYAEQTKRKFRVFKQKKGKRIKLRPERVIEKGKYLIDTKGEKRQLDIFKAMAQAEKRKQKKSKSSKPVGLSFA